MDNLTWAEWVQSERGSIEIAIEDAACAFIQAESGCTISNITIGKWIEIDKKGRIRYRANSGIGLHGEPYLNLTLKSFRPEFGDPLVFKSHEIVQRLWADYQNDNHSHAQDSAKADKRAQQARAEARIKRETSDKARNVAREIANFGTLSSLPLSENSYIRQKNLVNFVVNCGDIRYGHDKKGYFAAILLTNAQTNQPVGVQRFYDEKPAGYDTNKILTWGMSVYKEIACHQFGEILPNGLGTIMFCESIANAIVLNQVTGLPSVMTVDSGNLPRITAAYRDKFPGCGGVVV
jgi:hypothetical protein